MTPSDIPEPASKSQVPPSAKHVEPHGPIQKKLCSAQHAVGAIRDGVTLACGGFVGAGHAEALTRALQARYLSEGRPRDLTLVYAAGQGDGKTRGLNHLAHAGLLRRVIGGHWGLCPGLGKLALNGEIEAYNFPQGVLCQLYRDIAAGRPGSLTHVGMGTFIDPLNGGGKLNSRTRDDLVERVTLRGKEWLFYHTFPIHAAFIRASAADPFGNLITNEEALIGEILPLAQAAHNHGGPVIAQVRRLLAWPLPPQQVKVPGRLVTHIVVADEEDHWQTFGERFDPAFCSPAPWDIPGQASHRDLPIEMAAKGTCAVVRRIIAERACDELRPGMIANLGIGLPEGVAVVANERGLLADLTLTVESGPIGGVPAGGLSFGASRYPQAIVDQPAQFDFYDGGGLDFAALGAAQVDKQGNVNVSRFGQRFAGVGGFVNISQNAKRIVFCGALTADGLKIAVEGDRLRIVQEGRVAKFVNQVEQVSFAANEARKAGREALFVTERAVFRLQEQGIELIEAAPGIDIEQDILKQMQFRPIIGRISPMKIHSRVRE